MAKVVLGIDPGAKGAIAILSETGELIEVIDMPASLEANGRQTTNAPLLASVIVKSQANRIFCEFLASRPSDGVMQAFS
ncbi:MAG TPA: hypothetical protein VKS60_20315, partial [Stellaceae bacterium]|nr:hypothetical protein [Stellaceae bacterium]